MDWRTMVVWLGVFLVVLGLVGMLSVASMQNTKTKADASVAKAQEHTRRAEGRHDLIDALGWLRGFKAQREDR